MAVDGTAVGKGASLTVAEKAITEAATDEGPAGTEYGLLRLKSKTQTKKAITLNWNIVPGADKYVLFGNKCGKANKMIKLATFTGSTKRITSISGKKIKKGTYYKFILVAVDKNNEVVSTSKVIHIATKGGKVGNHKRVKIAKAVLKKAKKLKVGKKLPLKAKAVVTTTLKVKKHRAISYESSDTNIASVSRKGTVIAKSPGICYIYAYAQNGVYKRIKVIVR